MATLTHIGDHTIHIPMPILFGAHEAVSTDTIPMGIGKEKAYIKTGMEENSLFYQFQLDIGEKAALQLEK
jgi:hypothetical protein